MFKKILKAVGVGFEDSWKFFKGKKRWITLGLIGLSKIIPNHTVVGMGADFITTNFETIGIILEVGAGLFGTAAIVEVIEEKLPSGLSKKKGE